MLQHALAQVGIKALVKTGTYCSSSPPVPGGPAGNGALTLKYPDGTPLFKPGVKPTSAEQHIPIPDFVAVINPAAMPAGTELYFGYFSHSVVASMIYTNSYTCSKAPRGW